ncbi:MAG: hypothetical protein CMI28_00085 [Opitutae bacterium]|nr:hypothetical protein [Opitutae bacterium]
MKLEFLIWVLILLLLSFLLLPVYNTFKNKGPETFSEPTTNESFHYESWNQFSEEENSSSGPK